MAPENRNIALSYIVDNIIDSRLFRFVTMHAFDGRTDRQSDKQTDIDSKTVRMHSQSHGNKKLMCLLHLQRMCRRKAADK